MIPLPRRQEPLKERLQRSRPSLTRDRTMGDDGDEDDLKTIDELMYLDHSPSHDMILKTMIYSESGSGKGIRSDGELEKTDAATMSLIPREQLLHTQGSSSEPIQEENRDSNAMREGETVFSKEDVTQSLLEAIPSTLTKELAVSLSTSPEIGNDFPTTGPVLRLCVFVSCFDESVVQDPLYVDIYGPTPVDEVVDLVLLQYSDEARQPSLFGEAGLFDLRTIDEDDGSVDDDFPPLVRDRDILKFGMEAVAFCRAAGVGVVDVTTQKAIVKTEDVARYPSLRGSVVSNMVILRVWFGGQSTAVQMEASKTLDCILPKLKKFGDLSMEQCEFLPDEEAKQPLPWDIEVDDLKTDTLFLQTRSLEVKVLPTEDVLKPSDFLFTKMTAAIPTEYIVTKINQHGKKQKRSMRIADNRIYNLSSSSMSGASQTFQPSSFKFRASSKVKREYREISDVVKAEVEKIGSRNFYVSYRDLQESKILHYHYIASSARECAEIVAKIEFLRQQFHY